MSETTKRSTIYFAPQLHAALRLKSAHTHRSVSDIVNDAVRAALAKDFRAIPKPDVERVLQRVNRRVLFDCRLVGLSVYCFPVLKKSLH